MHFRSDAVLSKLSSSASQEAQAEKEVQAVSICHHTHDAGHLQIQYVKFPFLVFTDRRREHFFPLPIGIMLGNIPRNILTHLCYLDGPWAALLCDSCFSSQSSDNYFPCSHCYWVCIFQQKMVTGYDTNGVSFGLCSAQLPAATTTSSLH